MKQFDLQENEYDCNIEFPTEITNVSFRFSKDVLFKSWQDEALRHREEILQLKSQLQQKENIIKEVREILKYHLSNPSGTKNGWHIDIWNSEDINKLNEFLEILDKGE